jgi:hypothetical protein
MFIAEGRLASTHVDLPFCRGGVGISVRGPERLSQPFQVSPGDRSTQAQRPGVARGCYDRAEMRVFGQVALVAWCLGMAACGSSEPRSPLILGDQTSAALPGPRDLTSDQIRSLQRVITSVGEPCGGIVRRAFLRDIGFLHDTDPAVGWEAWEVQCTEAPYAVMVRADGTPAAVRRCVGGGFGDSPCAQPRTERAYRPYGGRQSPEAPLNPDLQKLLEPMTAKDGKTD